MKNLIAIKIYLLNNLMAISDCIDVHAVCACGVGNQVDFRELCLKEHYQGQTPKAPQWSQLGQEGMHDYF